ncbi:MAG: hypothetical protein KUG74_10990 [Rhodobacteraceae bacterium]|nr:hypothetical protein [Paracoccaceae bacterium]
MSMLMLSGAKDRLLPSSIPFRFFASASVFHILFWIALLMGADDLATFNGGTGWVLAAIHLATLGTFAMTAMGAAFQLLPIATRQPLVHNWPTYLTFWLFMPGTLILTFGMATTSMAALTVGGIATSSGLLGFALLTADNLRRASSLPLVTAHGWIAMISVLALTVLALLLIFDLDTGFLPDHRAAAATHMSFAAFGFMGVLVFGFSYVLIPMFALSRALPPRIGWMGLVFSALALAFATPALLLEITILQFAALLCAHISAAAYLWQMRTAFKTRMRKRLGPAFIVIRASWALLAISLLVALATLLGAPIPNGATLFGFLLLAGWLLTFLLGVLQRIMPFLASMHANPKDGRTPLLSELTAQRPLDIHMFCHGAALVLVATGIVTDITLLIATGAAIGLIGAIAFATFAALVIRKL